MTNEITIVVPTLNSDRTVEWTLFSLQKQDGCRVKIIVVDSGSTDSTLELCKLYDVEVLYCPPGNMYRAINVGLQQATTSWVGYLNSDDLVYPKSYLRLIELGNKKTADIVYGGCDFIDSENRFIHSYTPGLPNELLAQLLTSQLSFAQPATIFRRNVFEDLGGFDEKYTLAADLDFFLRAIKNKYVFGYLAGPPVACFRVSRGQLSQYRPAMIEEVDSIKSVHDEKLLLERVYVVRWKARNIFQYVVRILRGYQLSSKIRLVKTLDVNNYQDHG